MSVGFLLIALVCVSITVVLSGAAGVGGGSLYVPILLVFLPRFSFEQSTFLSSCVVFGNALGQFFFNFRTPHPRRASRAIIYWDLVSLLLPGIFVGVFIGSILRTISSMFVCFVVALVVILLAIVRSLMHFQGRWSDETKYPSKPSPLITSSRDGPLSSSYNDSTVSSITMSITSSNRTESQNTHATTPIQASQLSSSYGFFPFSPPIANSTIQNAAEPYSSQQVTHGPMTNMDNNNQPKSSSLPNDTTLNKICQTSEDSKINNTGNSTRLHQKRNGSLQSGQTVPVERNNNQSTPYLSSSLPTKLPRDNEVSNMINGNGDPVNISCSAGQISAPQPVPKRSSRQSSLQSMDIESISIERNGSSLRRSRLRSLISDIASLANLIDREPISAPSISYPLPLFLVTVSCFLVFVVFSSAAIRLSLCSVGFLILMSLSLLPLVILFVYSIHNIESYQRDSSIDIIINQDVIFSPVIYIFLILVSIIVGVVSSLIGVGGGEILGPIFLYLNILPSVSSATVMFLELFVGAVSVAHDTVNDQLPSYLGVVFAFLGLICGIGGRYLAFELSRRLYCSSVLVIALLTALLLSCVPYVYYISTGNYSTSFGSFC